MSKSPFEGASPHWGSALSASGPGAAPLKTLLAIEEDEAFQDPEPRRSEQDSQLLASSLISRAEGLKNERATWERHWQELADYVLPRRADFAADRQAGEARDRQFDSTASWACDQLAGALHGLLTSPVTPWFQLNIQGDSRFGGSPLRAWLDEVTEGMRALFDDPRANFQAQMHEMYMDIACFGTGIMYIGERSARRSDADLAPVSFATRHLSEIMIGENAEGLVDTVFRRFSLTARQAWQLWGENAGRAITEAMTRGNGQEDRSFEFLHAVMPREERLLHRRDSASLPWASYYINMQDRSLVGESGYHEFPWVVARWQKLVGEVFGRSPAMAALPDIKMINAMAKTVLTAGHMALDPPLQLPDDGYLKGARIRPGARFFRKPGQDRIEPILTGARVDIGLDMMNRVREQIMRAFYVEWFQLNQGPSMTATEVMARQQERMRLMGPMIGRLQSELLGPLIRRVFGLLSRSGMVPDPPVSGAGSRLKVDYVSPVARAMRASEAQAIQSLIGFAQPLAAVKPDIADNVDFDAALRHVADVTGVPNAVLRPASAVRAERRQREEAQAEALRQQQQQAGLVLAADMMASQATGKETA